ncbi:MAG: Gfo/Idh/MocA family protein [Rhizobiaceae bacterium]
MLRWGILSTAKIGKEHVIPAIQIAHNSNVTCIASRDSQQARKVADQFGIPGTIGSYEELLASDEIDAVYIPLLTSLHVEWSIKAANAGKHVLCEKPISLHANEIDAIIEARDRNGVVISEAFMVTYHPQWQKVRSLIAEGAVGTLRHVQSAFTYNNTDPDNMRNILSQGGGALPDIGVYPTVTTRFATGKEPRSVSAKVMRNATTGTDNYATWRADFGDFEMSTYVATEMALRQEISFHGDRGWIELSAPFNAGLYDADTVTLHDKDHKLAQSFRFAGVNQYTLQIEAFARTVAGGKSEVFSLEDSLNNQKLIDAIYKAGESGNWEDV